VSHTDPEVLALRALGETTGNPADDEHIATCPHCRTELTRLAEVVALAREDSNGAHLDRPAPAVWERIAAATGVEAAPAAARPAADMGVEAPAAAARPAADTAKDAGQPGSTGTGENADEPGSTPPAGRSPGRTWRRGRLAVGVAGLAAGLVIGIGATAGIAHLTSSPATSVIARVALRPLPQFPEWSGASGTATVESTAAGRVIDVAIRAPRRTGFYEVWLLARNGVSMISLGDLNASHTGSFTVPAGTDLGNYSRIDVSLQPFDGSTLHARTSVVRGSLPPAALAH